MTDKTMTTLKIGADINAETTLTITADEAREILHAIKEKDKMNEIGFDLLAENEELEAEVEKYKKAIEDIKLDIMRYEADCLLLEDRPICKECNDTMFGSIYHIIDKHINGKEQNNE